MEIGGRIAEILRDKKLKQKEFAEAIGEDPVSVNRYLKNTRAPKVEFIDKVVNYFPDVDLNWLFRGNTNVEHVREDGHHYVTPKTPHTLLEEIEEKIKELKAQMSQK